VFNAGLGQGRPPLLTDGICQGHDALGGWSQMKYVYLHGFNSAYDPVSVKVQALRAIGEVEGVTYNTFNAYPRIFAELSEQIPRDEVVLVGTSLGGFWAAEMAKHFGMPSVIINPAIEPRQALRKYVGQPVVNDVTGQSNTLSMGAMESYEGGITRDTFLLPLVLLDMGDEVIDAYATRRALEGCPMVCWDGGSHRFEHMGEAINEIEVYANHCSLMGLTND